MAAMNELLGRIKETAQTTPIEFKNKIEIETLSPMVLVSNILNFKVGDYIDIYGTHECVLTYNSGFDHVPAGFELRVRFLSDKEFSIFYPMGYIVWRWLNKMDREIGIKVFKSVASENENGIPYVKIWRAK